MAVAMGTDRRVQPRFPLVLAVRYLDAASALDYTEDLSAAGLFVCTERDLEVGDRLTLVVTFPQLPDPLELTVEVVRKRASSAGEPGGVAVRVPEHHGDRGKLAELARRLAVPRPSPAGFRVLLVEDNALVASMYAAALRRLSETEGVPPFAVEVAGDGAAALERLLRAPPVDVLVTDLFMPILSGISLVEKIRQEAALAELPVVVITGGGDRERERLAGLGVARFLRKPVNYQELVGAVRALLEARAGRDPGWGGPPAEG